MKIISYAKLPNTKRLKEILLSQAALDIMMNDEDSWLDWAKAYYEEEIPLECVKPIYEHENITREIIEKINPKRDIDAVIKELKMIGYII